MIRTLEKEQQLSECGNVLFTVLSISVQHLETSLTPRLASASASVVTTQADLAIRAAVEDLHGFAASQRTAGETDGTSNPLQDAFVLGNHGE